MKLRILPLLLLLLIGKQGFAQFSDFFRNSYVAVGVGPSYYFNSKGGGISGGGELTYGKWLLTTTGIRGQLGAQYVSNANGSMQLHYYGHFDVFFDILTALRNRNRSNFFRSYLAAGVGLVHTSSGDNDFCGLVGIGADFKVSDNIRLSAELEGLVHPSDFDDNTRSSLLAFFKLGASYDIENNPTRSRSRTETRQFANDWFFNLSLGAGSFNHKGITSFDQRLSLVMPVFGFNIGKRINNIWQLRLGMSGLYAQSTEDLFSYYGINGDLMLDIAGLFYSRNLNPLFTARPYASAGIVSRLDDQSHFLFSPGLGLQVVLRPRKNHEISLDARYVVTPSRFAHVSIPQSTLSVGMATLMIGYGYTFTRNSFK